MIMCVGVLHPQPEYHAKDILRLLLDKCTLFELQAQSQGLCKPPYTHTHTILLRTGGKQQVKLLESALSSLLQCEPVLRHYQPEEEVSGGGGEAQQQPDVSEGERDAFLVLLLTRLLGVLKQLVAAAMKKRFIPPQRQYPSLLG